MATAIKEILVVSACVAATVAAGADGTAGNLKAGETRATKTEPAGKPSAQTRAWRLLPLGDSITQGRADKGEETPATQSWRYPLWKALVDAGVEFGFVGSMTKGFNGSPSWPDYKGRQFDRDHEGHWGWPSWLVAEKLPGWLEQYDPPDIALVQLGGNGTKEKDHRQRNLKAMREIITLLRGRNPKVVILLGLPCPAWDPFPQMRKDYADLCREMNTKASPVVPVDHSPGWVSDPKAKDTDTVDWVHPNAQGDRKLAERWHKAMKPYLSAEKPKN